MNIGAGQSSLGDKAKRNESMYEAKLSCKNVIQNSILVLHGIVSKGSMYVCTCCDILWDKHGLKHVERLLLLKSFAFTVGSHQR